MVSDLMDTIGMDRPHWAGVAVHEKQQTLPAGGFVILSYAAMPHVKERRG